MSSYSKKEKDSFKRALKGLSIREFDYITFENIGLLACGGFSKVYHAYSKILGKHVALKRLHKDDNKLFHKNFEKKLTNILAANYHYNIIKFYGINPSTETYYLVLQYAKDGDLGTYLRNFFYRLDWTIKIHMAKDITNGLRYIHAKNIVHKGLHSKNILVHKGRLLITDIGLSQSLDTNSISVGGKMVAYLDPEYLRNQMKSIRYKRDKASDIYSLGVIFWELSSGKPPFDEIPEILQLTLVTNGERELPINGTPEDYIKIYSSAWNDNPAQRPTIENISDSLENIYNDSNDNQDIQLEALTNKYSKDSSSFLYTTLNSMNISPDMTKIVGSVGEITKPFVPLFAAVTLVISEISAIYETVQYNKKICNSLMDRVDAADAAIRTLKRKKAENVINFCKQEYYNSFIRFIYIMERIKKFMVEITNLHSYQKFVHSGSVKDRFDSLAKDFDVVMTELHFTIAVANDAQRKIDQSALESDISDMTKFLERIGDGIVDRNQKINTVFLEASLMNKKLGHPDSSERNIKANKIKSTDLIDPLTSKATDRRVKRNHQVIKKIYKNFEVACKPIDLQNSDPKETAKIQEHLAILGKLRDSPNIIRFYGLSYIENSDVTVFEWAEYGSLRELYCKYDIAWHVKVRIALDICRGFIFLHSCDILHHDIRCEHIMMATGLVPKIAKFKYSHVETSPTTDMKDATEIMRWMAPEKLRDSTYPYTFKCEIFSFGMLLWELVFEKIPYEKWDILKIKEYVLAGNREKITWGRASSDVEKLQKGLAKIIVSAWQGDPAIRASLQNIFMNLVQLADEYCTGKETEAKLLPDKALDLDGSAVSISDEGGLDLPDMDMDFNIDEIPQIIPLEEGIAAHRNKEHAKAWKCFLAHADLNNATAKYWKGYYLWEGIEIEKDRKQACELFKEAADDEIADAQLRYAFSLVNNPPVKFDRDIFLKYITKAADNNNPTAQYNLGEVYFYGKLNQKKDEELGKKYLRLAALNNQPKAKEVLQKLGINVYTDI
ncbi:10875_t:CDS:2 [Diversispora eburnea]|uniref:10875_t:CDS:1 n=1 Tax=Diversispora eburnea TaxID=1213867 RepID=A0A9N9AUN6_9GLOM|nr:10875_t:CDS:2 [Diversispora eburnea]